MLHRTKTSAQRTRATFQLQPRAAVTTVIAMRSTMRGQCLPLYAAAHPRICARSHGRRTTVVCWEPFCGFSPPSTFVRCSKLENKIAKENNRTLSRYYSEERTSNHPEF